VVVGYERGGHRESKAAMIAEALRRIRASGSHVTDAVMVGDRSHDLEGAAANGIDGVWAAWGYGDPSEAMRAVAVARDFADLRQLVRARRSPETTASRP
jgi:phosphoglycolate phosphatase